MFEDIVADYRLAILSLIALAIIVLAQSFLGAIFGLVVGKSVAGQSPAGDHTSFAHRALRTHLNSVENLSAFALSVLVAIIVGVAPHLLNLLAPAHVGLRVLHWLIYYAGVPPHQGGPRTIVFILGWGTNLAIAVLALLAVL